VIHELRIYTVHPGRMGALLARFRDHTCALFEKHGMVNVGYWTNVIGGRTDELWYILGYPDLGARERAWHDFATDPEWHAVAKASEADGAIVHHIDNRILAPTDFSPIR
jgi:NIPSNAP